MNIVYYKQIARRLNSLKTKRRYKEKRERRAYLTEAFIDGELALYKPVHIPYKIFTDKLPKTKIETPVIEKPVHLTWFDKFILWIRKIFS